MNEPTFNLNKISVTMPFTHEQMDFWREPTAEERARWRGREEAAKKERARIIAVLAAAPTELQPIIKLHSPDSRGECQGCDIGSYAESNPDWPCRTIDLILESAA